MRLRFVRALLMLAIVGNIIIWYRIWRLFIVQDTSNLLSPTIATHENSQKFYHQFARLVTIVIRQFETFENDVVATVESVLNVFPTVTILIVSDQLPYPPLGLNLNNSSMQNVRLINLQPGFNTTYELRDPMFYIRTKFVALLPDATQLTTERNMQEMLLKVTNLGMVAIPVGKAVLGCLRINLKIKEWSLKLTSISSSECDIVTGKHVTMLETKILKKLSDPFLLPFTDALYIQIAATGSKVHVMRDHQFNNGKLLYRNQQTRLKVNELHQNRERSMFQKFGIKMVTRASGSVEWYGCTRDTTRCFGTVINEIPSYLYENRYTPPCCLMGLRKVAQHVFNELEEVGIRYWLEGESLLGAMRSGDILPWSHEIHIGINRDDLKRSQWLMKAQIKPIVDYDNFVWEKAVEGEFFKVRYSKVNHLNVNLLPFYAKNGSMVKDSWFLKNRDFPEQFLHPMSNIEFAGRQVPCPNNIRDFLELKYFKGMIENPELPINIPLD